MKQSNKFLVGFDRFIALDWADYAMNLGLQKSLDRNSKVTDLKNWLSTRIIGEDSCRKTANVLTRLWIEEKGEIDELRDIAEQIFPHLFKDEWVVLHYCISIVRFPFFHRTMQEVGRLLLLQGSFQRRDIHQRVGEQYSNKGSVPRSIDRIIQSLEEWGLLEKIDSSTYISNRKAILNDELYAWVLLAILKVNPSHRILVQDAPIIPELFPFEGQQSVQGIVSKSQFLRIERDGANGEFLLPVDQISCFRDINWN